MLGYIIVVVFCAVVAVVWLSICIPKYKKWSGRIKNCTLEVPVQVVEIYEKRTRRGYVLCKPVFESVDPTNQVVIDSAYYSNLISFEVGDELVLLINPNDPKEFIYKDKRNNKGLVADMVACCMPILVIILYLVLKYVLKL
ncbi:MAG: hypothetical protein IKS48_08690 [Eubacterium sp.]|nr:hypothetical protein [Eubacterium sp.]